MSDMADENNRRVSLLVVRCNGSASPVLLAKAIADPAIVANEMRGPIVLESAHHLFSSLRATDRVLLVYACLLMGLVFVCGGSSQQSGLGVMLAQLLAIPGILVALALGTQRGSGVRWSAPLAVGLFVVLPVVQLLPLTEFLWSLPANRVSLKQDLDAAGVAGIDYRWTLSPSATERAFLSLLPAAALFFVTMVIDSSALRALVSWVICLCLFTAFLAVAQLGASQTSFLNPFPQYVPAMTGVFANRNHQASALAVGLLLSVAMMFVRIRLNADGSNASLLRLWISGMIAAVFALTLPVVGSRGGIIIALVMTALLVFALRARTVAHPMQRWQKWLYGVIPVAGLLVGSWAAFSWAHADAIGSDPGTRSLLAKESIALAMSTAPWGSGVGVFTQAFEQASDLSVAQAAYINHAHNEYVQWWVEGGILGLACMLCALVTLYRIARRSMRADVDANLRVIGLGTLTATLSTLLHSLVDYPLRTPALMAMSGLLGGISVAALRHRGLGRKVARVSP